METSTAFTETSVAPLVHVHACRATQDTLELTARQPMLALWDTLELVVRLIVATTGQRRDLQEIARAHVRQVLTEYYVGLLTTRKI